MAVFPFFGYVRADEDHARTATFTATTETDGAEAVKAKNDDPTDYWQAESGTATLTLTWGAPVSVGVLGIIMPNFDHDRDVAIEFDDVLVATLKGSRGLNVTGRNGYPRNLRYLPSAAVNVSKIDITVTGNSADVAIGRVAAGPVRKLEGPLSPGAQRQLSAGTIEDVYPEFGHSIDYGVGGQTWMIKSNSIQFESGLEQMIDLWEASEYGVKRMLVIPSDGEPVRWVKCANLVNYTTQIYRGVEVTFFEIGRGIPVA